MARLVYPVIISLDGYVNDVTGGFDWAAPDEEVHAFVNALERPVGTHLYGRRLYEVMAVWETLEVTTEESPAMVEYAGIWRAADKVVYSSTLDEVRTPRTRLERTFDAESLRELKNSASQDLSIGGPGLAAHALRAGLVDDVHLVVVPWVVGGGTRAFPDDVRLALELVSQRRFDSGTVHLHYRAKSAR